MASDLEALLAAVVANPADDVARLVYADCLEENGNAPRARFIRLQIEAERYHPNSNAHAERTAEAAALFATHWPDWWAEVCAATGLRPAARAPKSALGRLARWAGVGPRPGATYELRPAAPFTIFTDRSEPNSQFTAAVFTCGFPDVLCCHRWANSRFDHELLARWARAVPLKKYHCDAECLGAPGPHLAGLRELFVSDPAAPQLDEWLDSPHLGHLESLEFVTAPLHGMEWPAFFSRSILRRLKRLRIVLDGPAITVTLAEAETLDAVRELDLELMAEPGGVAFAALCDSRLGWNVESLGLSGALEVNDVRSLGDWARLRELHLWFAFLEDTEADPDDELARVRALVRDTSVPGLEVLGLTVQYLTDVVIDELVRSPLTKQLRHSSLFAVHDRASGAALRRLPDAFDPARIETIFVRTNVARPELAELTRAFGDRVRLVTA